MTHPGSRPSRLTCLTTLPSVLRVSRPPSYLFSRWVFLRLLGLTCLIAFVSLAVQLTGLVGADGILPAGVYLDRLRDSYTVARPTGSFRPCCGCRRATWR